MPPVVVDGTLSIRVVWTAAGSPLGQNVLNARIGSGPAVNQAMATTIAGHLESAHTSSGLDALQSTDVSMDLVEIRDLREPNQPLISAAIGSPGLSAANLVPRGNSLVVTSRTALAGRSFRGRTYVPGFSDEATDASGRATQAAQDAATAFIVDFGAAMDGEGWPLGVASLVSGGVRRDPGIITLIDSWVCRNAIWDRQWRRALR